MATFQLFWGLFAYLSLYLIPCTPTPHVHIVYLGRSHSHDPLLTTKLHVQLLSSVFSSEHEAEKAMLYSYKHAFSGFAAVLNSTQATTLERNEQVISVFRSNILQLHTTRSWDFLGLREVVAQTTTAGYPNYGCDVIVGVLDTGIWPESESFKEVPGMGPVPASWRGECIKGEKFDPSKACNRKLIGARYYISGFEQDFGPLDMSGEAEYMSPRDRIGHGTHSASVAVGSPVPHVSYSGLGYGTARGGATLARLAVYKVCWFKDREGKCSEADILAAFDEALHDGVHVISAAIGSPPPLLQYFKTCLDIGSFHAAQLGVPVVFSAGNDGPEASLVQNVSPWGLCVGAGTIDRSFPSRIVLGGNISFTGQSFVKKGFQSKLMDSGKLFTDGVCSSDKWNHQVNASGYVVLCFSSIGQVTSTVAAQAVLNASGSGMIFVDSMTRLYPQDDLLPTVHVNLEQGTQILYYIQSCEDGEDPTVQILPSCTVIGSSVAPSVAYFSSRGPSSISPNILKPDIIAPGVNILAAWSQKSTPTFLPSDKRSVEWNFDSGTSMSCSHVAGIVALVKSVHPDWSPAAIKSAIMTTAHSRDTSLDRISAGGTLKSADAFDVGAGQANPLKAFDPGLVYDMETRDYVVYLCSLGYTEAQIKSMLLPSPYVDTCCVGNYSDVDLNYPAITVSDLHCTITVKRTLRNVGRKNAIYFGAVKSPHGVNVILWPTFLVFSWRRQTITYYVTLTPLKRSRGRYDFGEIVWFDGYHRVRTPLTVRVNNINVEKDVGGGNAANASAGHMSA